MTVQSRTFERARIGNLDCLAAVRTDDEIVAAFSSEVSPAVLRANVPKVLGLRQVGRGLLARLPGDLDVGADRETDVFCGCNVLVAIRNGETPEAARDWVDYHAKGFEAEATIVIDRDPPGGPFADSLGKFDLSIPTVVVSVDSPLGQEDGPDARHESMAPAAPARSQAPCDPWHAPLSETVIFELIRHRFLSEARAVAVLNIGDLVLPDDEGSPFRRALSAVGQVVPMTGIEVYPWRLRRGAAAPHGDHIAFRKNETRWLASWCLALEQMPSDILWQPTRPLGVRSADCRPVAFRRAMGVTFPTVPVNALVDKSDLVEDPELVPLMRDRFGSKPIRLPSPAQIAPRGESRVVTIVTAMKNEGPFVLDWIAHNRAIGIDRHLVYTNDCEDGTDSLLNCLSQVGVVRRDNPYKSLGKVPQFAAFAAARTEPSVTSADWLMTLDVDEYINIHTGEGRIDDLLSARPDAHVFSLPWRLFGNAGLHRFEDRPVAQLHDLAAPAFAPKPLQAWGFKSMFRNAGLFRRLGVHRPNGLDTAFLGQLKWVDGSGRAMPPTSWRSAWRMSTATWGYELASVNHYAVRNAESFLVKRDRGRVNHTEREQGLAYWFRMNHNAEREVSIRRLDERVEREKEQLMSLPGVAEAHDRAVDWHRSRIVSLLEEPETLAFYREITSPRMEKLSRIATSFGSNVYLEGPQVIPDEIVDRDPSEPFFFTVERSGNHRTT